MPLILSYVSLNYIDGLFIIHAMMGSFREKKDAHFGEYSHTPVKI